jgi:hypothetical protein
MVLPLIVTLIAIWILILSLLIGVCLSARQGDLQQQQQLKVASAHPASDDPIGPPATSSRIGSITAQPPGTHAHPPNPTVLTSGVTG